MYSDVRGIKKPRTEARGSRVVHTYFMEVQMALHLEIKLNHDLF
jgi:hypothetical protein